jgi:predicted nucleic acid-binding protein
MVSAHDAVHAAVVFHHGVERIATFDRGFEKVEVIRQIRLP